MCWPSIAIRNRWRPLPANASARWPSTLSDRRSRPIRLSRWQNERFGKPSRPEFLLKDGELLDLVRGRFSVTAYEARMISQPKMAMVQRIAARLL